VLVPKQSIFGDKTLRRNEFMKNHQLSYIVSTSLCAALFALWLVACSSNNDGGGGGSAAGAGGTDSAISGTSGGGTSGTGGTGGTGGADVTSGTGGNATGGAGAGGAGGTGGDTTGGSGTGGTAGTDTENTGAVTVKLDATKQTMEGFGINNNWAPAMTDQEADLMFDTTIGIGLSILRIGMGPDGNAYNPGNNCWQDIAKAKARGVTTFVGSLWSPLGDYKAGQNAVGGAENGGGHVKPEYYEQWANTIAAFPAKVKQNANVDLYAMSVQNEPDFASCGFEQPCNGNYATTLFTADEMVAFVKVVGPKLRALTPPVKVMAPEASEWVHLWSNESAPGSSDPLNGTGYDYGHVLYNDTTAWGLVDIIGIHQYDTQVAEPWPSDVPDVKPIWQTEMSGVKWWPEEGPSVDINNGVAVAGWIHEGVVNGLASAWLWWWWKAMGETNEGLLLANGTDTKRHYTLGNFSKFIRPGYTRVDITGSIPTDVLLSAYKGTDGTVVVVAINKGAASASVPISISGGTAPTSLTPWVTSVNDDLVSKPAVTVSGGSFTAALDTMTVTTFVGK
jgi:glucuronoarabinoxylan endo-1,4-beta-xylanase